jgi:hypothetical protein
MNVVLNPKKITTVFVIATFLLLIAHLIAQYRVLVFGDDWFYGFGTMFNFNLEKNAPTYFSSLILAVVAMQAAAVAIANRGKRYFWHWLGMSVIFLFVSFDELVAVHEKLTRPLRDAFQLSGLLYYAWVIPYAIALFVLAFFYFRFILDLPPKTRFRFILAGGLFVSGAMGLEMIGGAIFDEMGTGRNLPYVILMTFEELLEMGATIFFIYTLFSYIQEYLPGLHIAVAAPVTAEQVEAASISTRATPEPLMAKEQPQAKT